MQSDGDTCLRRNVSCSPPFDSAQGDTLRLFPSMRDLGRPPSTLRQAQDGAGSGRRLDTLLWRYSGCMGLLIAVVRIFVILAIAFVFFFRGIEDYAADVHVVFIEVVEGFLELVHVGLLKAGD